MNDTSMLLDTTVIIIGRVLSTNDYAQHIHMGLVLWLIEYGDEVRNELQSMAIGPRHSTTLLAKKPEPRTNANTTAAASAAAAAAAHFGA